MDKLCLHGNWDSRKTKLEFIILQKMQFTLYRIAIYANLPRKMLTRQNLKKTKPDSTVAATAIRRISVNFNHVLDYRNKRCVPLQRFSILFTNKQIRMFKPTKSETNNWIEKKTHEY